MPAHAIFDRVRETSVTAGTGPITLAGAVNGFRTFGSVMAVGDTCEYVIVEGASFEVGLGTYSGTNTLSRTFVKSSTNSGAAVSFTSAVKDVGLVVSGKRQDSTFGLLARGHIVGLHLS